MIKTILKLQSFLDRQSKLHIWLLTIPMFFVMILEMASIGLIVPFLQIVLVNETENLIIQGMLVYIPNLPKQELVLWASILLAGLFFIKNILIFGLTYLINWVVMMKSVKFGSRLFMNYLSKPLEFHLQRNSAEILRNLMSGTGSSFQAIRFILFMVLDTILMISAFLLLLTFEPSVTLIATGSLIFVGGIYHWLSSPIFRFWGACDVELEGKLIKWINQAFGSIRDVKLHHAYGYFNNGFFDLARDRATYIALSTTSINIPRLLLETVVVVGFILVIAFLQLGERSVIEIVPTIGLFGMAAMRLLPSMNRLLTNATELKQRTAFVDTLYADLTTTEWKNDLTGYLGEEKSDNDISPFFNQEMRFEDASYVYPNSIDRALHNVSLSISKGQSVGIVGPSGAGKSTLLDMVLGLLRPNSGRVLVDGVDIDINLSAWQRRIGFVPQHVNIMDDTVARNIAFGAPDAAIDTNRLNKAIDLSHFRNVLESLDLGLDTMLGESGTRLSGGQRQRIAIARALYNDPEILIFDEATSALDNETEYEITKAIQELAGEKTIIVIAHRLSTVKKCDHLVFMKEGQIQAVGSYEELKIINADFRRMAEPGIGSATSSSINITSG